MPRLAAVPDRPLRAFLYSRVSMVGGREEIISPHVQATAGRDRAAAAAWHVVREITELDVTGRNFARAGVREAIEGVEAGLWEVVLVYRYNRFGRNVRDSLVNIARVEAAGGQVVSCTEPFDAATAIGKYGRTNLLALAELESDLIGENWKAAHANRRRRGLPHSGHPRFGYRYTTAKRYVPDSDWEPVVVELYRRYAAGVGVEKLADWLASLGAPTQHQGGRWAPSSVAYYLRAGFAAGLLHFGDGSHEPGSHQAIIGPALWDEFRAADKRRRAMPPRSATPTTPLSGLVRCTDCESTMSARSDSRQGRAYLYACRNRRCGSRPAILRRTVEAQVLAFLADLDADVTTRAAAKVVAVDHRASVRAERRQLAREVTRLDRALVKLTKDNATSLVPDRAYAVARDELEADRGRAADRLEALGEEAQVRPPDRATVRGLLRDWDVLPVLRRRALLGEVLTVRVERVDGRSRATVRGCWE